MEIQKRQILPGECLPSTRALSRYLQVSRSTVDLAYMQLMSEGYIESIPYRGYFVCELEGIYQFPEEEAVPDEKSREIWRNTHTILRSMVSMRMAFRRISGEKYQRKSFSRMTHRCFSWEIRRRMGTPPGSGIPICTMPRSALYAGTDYRGRRKRLPADAAQGNPGAAPCDRHGEPNV